MEKIPWRRAWQPTPVFLENTINRGVWWAKVYRVTKSWTQLKWLGRHTYKFKLEWFNVRVLNVITMVITKKTEHERNTTVITERWMDKQNAVFAYNGILQPLKGNIDTGSNIDEPRGHYSEWNKPATKIQILCDSTHMKYLEQSNSLKQKVEWGSWGPDRKEEWGVIV